MRTLVFCRHEIATNPTRRHLVHAAISNETGTALFGRCLPQDEGCALDSSRPDQLGKDKVPLLTVDEMLQRYDVPYVDILKASCAPSPVQALLPFVRASKRVACRPRCSWTPRALTRWRCKGPCTAWVPSEWAYSFLSIMEPASGGSSGCG